MQEEVRPVFIYELIDPRTDQTRYIGRTFNPRVRFNKHLNPVYLNENNHRCAWIKNLLSLGLKPIMGILDKVSFKEWEFWERHYISLFRSWGCDLTNGTDGGDDDKKYFPKTIENLSKSHMGYKPKQESIDKRRQTTIEKYGSVGAFGRVGHEAYVNKYSKEERIEQMKVGHLKRKERGPWHSEETKKKMSLAQKGRKRGPHSEEHRQRISDGNKGKKMSLETRKKMSESRIGIKYSDETIARMSASHKGKYNGKKIERLV